MIEYEINNSETWPETKNEWTYFSVSTSPEPDFTHLWRLGDPLEPIHGRKQGLFFTIK